MGEAVQLINFWLEGLEVAEINHLDGSDIVVVFSGMQAPFGAEFYRCIEAIECGGYSWKVRYNELYGYAVDRKNSRAVVNYRLISGEAPPTPPKPARPEDIRATFVEPSRVAVDYRSKGKLHKHTFLT